MTNTFLKIWLDDLRPAPQGWTDCKTYDIFLQVLHNAYTSNSVIDAVSLDHDIQDHHIPERTGYTAVLLFAEQKFCGEDEKLPKKIMVHTKNPVGRTKMIETLQKYVPDLYDRTILHVDVPDHISKNIEDL